jgi:transcriptional regulator with XRE-family HTH domain
MTTRHLHRKIKRTPEEIARLRADRERYQRERPTPEQLLAEGGHKEFVTLGELLMLHQVVAQLKQEREQQGLTLADMTQRTGIEQAALSRLETGKNSNPTFDTLYRVADALGKTICFTFQDAKKTPQSKVNGPVGGHSSKMAQRVKDMIEKIGEEKPHLKRAFLQDTWGHDVTWMVGIVQGADEEGLPVRTWTQKYLTAMSLGPWRIPRQVNQKNLLLSQVGDAEWSTLSRDTVADLPFVLPWQKQQAIAFHRNLQQRGSTLDALCDELKGKTGDEAYCEVAKLSGVKGYSKCLDFFVREALCLDTVPRDRHVRRVLKRFGLSKVPRRQLPQLIREAGFEPRLVARVLYEQGLALPMNSAFVL